MGLLVVVLEDAVEPSVAPTVVNGLAELGVTSLSVVRDDGGLAVVLEGWAFDPERSGEAAATLISGPGTGRRRLYSVMHLSISASRGLQAERPAEASAGA